MRTLAVLLAAAGLAACAAMEEGAPPPSAPATASYETRELSSETGPGDRLDTGRKHGLRSAVVAPSAAAASAHPLATQVALDTMKAGGSAMDAAIAANAMLGLVEPTGNGIGGDLFALVWDPETQELYGYNGSGRSPMGATLEDMQAAADEHMEGEEIPPYGAASVTVPGTVDGWFALHERFGKRAMADNLRPAIEYAENGAPIPEVIAYYWNLSEERYRSAHESGMLEEVDNAIATYFSPTPREGSLFRNPDLARTYRRIAAEGRDVFYKGEIARSMDAYMQRIGGHLRYEDFARHEGEWVEPVCVDYREARLCELGPNTQGVAALQMLQMLEGFDMRGFGYGSPDSLMAQVEAKRLAFADRARSYADPAFSGIDPEVFIAPGFNDAKAGRIDLEAALSAPQAHDPALGLALESADGRLREGDTTYLTTADANGMMVSLIQSNYRGMGSGLVPDGLGFMFQDRGQLFSLDPEHPNVFEPGKRPFHTIIPAFAFKKDMPGCQVRATAIEQACPYEPWLSFGLMGGGMQPQGHVQIILNLIDHDMGLQEAGDAARWRHTGGCEPTDDLNGDDCERDMGTVYVESGLPEATRAALEARGHTVRPARSGFGGYQAIMRDFETGAWIAATELRKDGAAGGY